MTGRNRELDNLALRLDRAANTIPDVYAHLDEQRAHIAILAAQNLDGMPNTIGSHADPTAWASIQRGIADYRQGLIDDAIETLIVAVKMLEQNIRFARRLRLPITDQDDNLDHLNDAPRCIGNGPSGDPTITCHQIPSPRKHSDGTSIDDGRCLDCGRQHDQTEQTRKADAANARRLRRYRTADTHRR